MGRSNVGSKSPFNNNLAEPLELTTTATTANQEIGNYTPQNKEKIVIHAILVEVHKNTLSTTEEILGEFSIKWDSTVILGDIKAINPTSSAPFGFIISGLELEYVGDGIKKLSAICTPAIADSITWRIGIFGRHT